MPPMDTRTIEARLKVLQKAVAENGSTSTITAILDELRRGVQATEQTLRTTRAGVIVNKLRQHKAPEVQKCASEIVARWRQEVNRQKAAKVAAGQAQTTAAARSSIGTAGAGAHDRSATAVNGGAGSPSSATSTPSASSHALSPMERLAALNSEEKLDKCSVPPNQRDYRKEGLNIAVTGEPARDAIIGLLYNGLCPTRTEPPRFIVEKAVAIEAAALRLLGEGQMNSAYRSRMRSLFQNLKQPQNPGLRVRVLTGEFTPDDFVTATNEQLMSEERRELEKKYQRDNMNRAMVAKQERSVSSSLQCGKCGQRKVTYTEAQTRSADEPMTLFCTCMNCGKTWKQ
ncbi:RNA polymerase II elongation factor [Ascosphaera acerosa]|nr:RNA polymerase II elongation factor [Ascosphaera acerosa]